MPVDVVHIAGPGLERWILEHILQEEDIGLHSTDPEFVQAAEHPMDGSQRVHSMGRHRPATNHNK